MGKHPTPFKDNNISTLSNNTYSYSSINSSIAAPGGTIGKTLSSLSISKFITTGVSFEARASFRASSTSSCFVTFIPIAP